jgi:hypothetical protein
MPMISMRLGSREHRIGEPANPIADAAARLRLRSSEKWNLLAAVRLSLSPGSWAK